MAALVQEADRDSDHSIILRLPNGYGREYDLDIYQTVSQEVMTLYHQFGHHGLPGTAADMVMVLCFSDGRHRILPNNSKLANYTDHLCEADHVKIMHANTAAQLPL